MPTPVTEDVATPIATSEAASWLRDYDRVARAIEWLDAHRVAQPRLGDVAAALALSASHLQRTFTRFAGVSPTLLLRWLTADAARRLLRERSTVLDTTSAVGLSSPGRLHDLFVTLDGVTPGEISKAGRGITLRTGVHPTPLGLVFVATSDRGVVALRFVDGDPVETRRTFRGEWPAAQVIEDPEATADVVARFTRGLIGAPAVPVPVFAAGTNLQIKVWEALLTIPEASVASYSDVAVLAGNPQAVRAVASAVGRNPVGALIPCHRVLRATGGIGGYRWGEVRKRAMLAREAARADA